MIKPKMNSAKANRISTSLLFISSSLTIISRVQGIIRCTKTQECVEALREGSECVDGICSNPFEQGCLRRYLGEDEFISKRICNSHDPSNANELGLCDLPLFDYTEMRISSQDWDSAMLSSWVMQIFLSEILQVPTSIETSNPDHNNNFYDPKSDFTYESPAYDYDAIRTAVGEGGSCENVVRENIQNKDSPDYEYRSCAHILPEAWNGENENMRNLEAENIIEPAEGSGGVAKTSWMIPRFVAEANHSLLSHFGMRGEEGRRMLAETFHRPTNWKDYCQLVSSTNCTVDDGIATRPPKTDSEEEEYYFLDGSFKGHFRRTKENDCETYPETCTGHITNVMCTWTTYAVPQAYYADIAVESNGPSTNGGYPYQRMVEIWKAANATKSPVLFYWHTPDPTVQEFIDSEGEFQEVLLPVPSQTCVEHRVSPQHRCSENLIDQIGSPLGGCDDHPTSIKKLIAGNLYDVTMDITEAKQSPAYDAISRFKISDLEINEIFGIWYRRNTDRYNYDPREAVCEWTAQHIDDLMRYVPRTYPRSIRAMGYERPVMYTAISFGVFTCLLVIGTTIAVYMLRTTPVMKTAQVSFMMMLLGGLFLVALASILIAIEPTRAICIVLSWLVTLGYTMELAPLIIKVSAILKLMNASKKLRRMKISRQKLFTKVIAIVSIAVIFLICWTIIDPLTKEEQYSLTNETNEEGGNVVQFCYFCGSNNETWRYAAMVWQVILILCATVLAVQSRNIRSEFNETQSLAFMVYSHSMFVVLRVILMIWEDLFMASTLAACLSFIYSIDTIVSLISYFLPKMTMIANQEKNRIGTGGVSVYVSPPTNNNSFPNRFESKQEGSFAAATVSSTQRQSDSSTKTRKTSVFTPSELKVSFGPQYGADEDVDSTDPEDLEDQDLCTQTTTNR